MDHLISHVGISPIGVIAVATSAAVMYLALGLVLRIWGRRFSISASPLSLVVVTLIGAISARAILGDSPTLGGGLVGIATLLVMEQIFGHWAGLVTSKRRGKGWWRRVPVILMIGNDIQEPALRKYGMTQAHLWSQLRQRGIFDRDEVDLVILEPRGQISIVRAGALVSPETLAGVQGMEKVPASMIRPTEPPREEV